MTKPTGESSMRTGMKGFVIVWLGQLLSLLGTSMTTFALTIWAFQETGRATDLALIGFFFMLPLLLISPFAGAIVDRSNRKLMMMISDLASGVVTIIILILYLNGWLQIWHLYISAFITGTFQTFQWPAYSAAISTMLPKEQFARANGLIALAGSGSGILAPALAGAVLALAGMGAIFAIDIVTFLLAIGALLIVSIPQPKETKEGEKSKGSLWSEAVFGFRYIWRRPSLLGLQLVFLFGNFFNTLGFTLLAPMILARTNSNELVFGSVQSISAIGGVAGGLIMSTWGGPKKLVWGVLGGWAGVGVAQIVLGLGNTAVLWGAAGFLMGSLGPIINGSNQAIWQAKVEPDLQGRVFSIRRLVAWVATPLAMLTAGPLADFVMEPAMQAETPFSQAMGRLVGQGSGAGMSLIILGTGALALMVAVIAMNVRVVRDVDALLPDQTQVTDTAVVETAV